MTSKGLPSRVAFGVEACKIFCEREMIFVVGVGFDGGDDLILGDEARDVVDVAMGVVAGAAAVEPEDLVDAELLVECGFELLFGDAGVALLDL